MGAHHNSATWRTAQHRNFAPLMRCLGTMPCPGFTLGLYSQVLFGESFEEQHIQGEQHLQYMPWMLENTGDSR